MAVMMSLLESVRSPPRSELVDLLRAARQHPGDVARRLVLADWLEEYGEESDHARAELIRIQCRLEPELSFPGHQRPWVAPALDAERAVLFQRQDELLTRYEASWLGPLRELAPNRVFHQGMVFLDVDVQKLRRRSLNRLGGTETWAWVAGVKLHGATSHQLSQLPDCPQLADISSVTFAGDVQHAEMRAFLRAGCFQNLRELRLAQTCISEKALGVLADAVRPPALQHLCLCRSGVTPGGAERLARSAVLDGLTTLDLRCNRLGDAALEALVASPRLGRLTHLLLAGNRLGPRTARALTRSPFLSRLRYLDLARNPLGPAGVEILAKASGWSALAHLDLGQTWLTTEGVHALLASPHLQQLRHLLLEDNEIGDRTVLHEVSWPAGLQRLDLAGNPLGERGLADLVAAAPPEQLRCLSLGFCGLSARSLEVLTRSGWLDHLTELDLSGNYLGMAGLRALTRSANRACLGSLGLANCDLDDEGPAVLAASWNPGQLACLHLADNQIGPAGVRALACAGGLEGLTSLDLSGNPVGDEAVVALVESPGLPRLSMLDLTDCDLTNAGVIALAHTPGLARIRRLALASPDIGPAGIQALLDSPYTTSLRVLVLKAAIHDLRMRQALQEQFACSPVCWTSS
jgi:uncharacterized protein (TIGR02996 family)